MTTILKKLIFTILVKQHGLSLNPTVMEILLKETGNKEDQKGFLEKITLQYLDAGGPATIDPLILRKLLTEKNSFETKKGQQSILYNLYVQKEPPLSGKVLKENQRDLLFQKEGGGDLIVQQRYTILKKVISKYLGETDSKALIKETNELLEEVECVVFGLLSFKNGLWFMEDTKGTLLLKLENASYGEGLFISGAFVLFYGKLAAGTFAVSHMRLPPTNYHKELLKHKNTRNYLQEQEDSVFFLFFSFVSLDIQKEVEALLAVFKEFVAEGKTPKTVFIFGPLFEGEVFKKGKKFVTYKKHFENFQQKLKKIGDFAEKTKIVFIPDKMDPFEGERIPKEEIPKALLHSKKMTALSSLSNPAKIVLEETEIFLYNQNSSSLFLNALNEIPTEQRTKTLFQTIFSQLFLPIGKEVSSFVLWEKEEALSLFSLPDILIAPFGQEAFYEEIANVLCLAPGSFAVNREFIAFFPRNYTMQKHRLK